MNRTISHNLVEQGTQLSCSAASQFTVKGYLEINITNDFGIHPDNPEVHDNHARGLTMWLGGCGLKNRPEVIFDFGGVFPIGELQVWNFNQEGEGNTAKGIREAVIYFSVDANNWHELKGGELPFIFARASGKPDMGATNLERSGHPPVNFGGVSARYVKICPVPVIGVGNWGGSDEEGNMLFGLSEVRFFAGSGLMVFRDDRWTDLFRRYEGWTGADGIFSIPFNRDERPGSSFSGKTLLLFSDTFIGSVDRQTCRRNMVMLNNTLAVLEGNVPDPEQIRFIYRTNDMGKAGTVFDQDGVDHFELAHKNYFWLQDGIIVEDKLQVTALNVYHNPDGPEGLKFGVDGVSLVTCPMTPEGPDIDNYTVRETPLYHAFPDGGKAFVGCGVLPNTEGAGAVDPDGYIYVYGYINKNGRSDLIASRTTPERYEDFSTWEFFTGSDWSAKLADVSVIAENVSHELSVSPVLSGKYKAKFILVFTKDISGPLVSCRIGDTPVGPFGEMIDLFHSDEWLLGEGITTYNAKAHPHLSKPGELLISYNVNTLSMDTHFKNGDVYRPRFLVVKEIV